MIHLSNLRKSFGQTAALDNLNLEIPDGEIFGLLGANGAGKTTTIQVLLGFINPDSGEVRVQNMDVLKDASATRQLIGYIPENVHLYPYLSGLENLDYFSKLAGNRYTQAQLSDFLSTCGLATEAHHKRVSTYSKGMRQKVGIAIAYAKKARVYLLDEPASGLDPLAGNELTQLLRKLAQEGASILMASHDIFRVREVSSRIGILKKGQLVQVLQADSISAAELEQLYIQYMQN
jgi:ABC-2 type transport system ATP-binding protein